MKHIDVTSQLDRHKLLMDLAKTVNDHLDKHPGPEANQEPEEPYPHAFTTHHSSK